MKKALIAGAVLVFLVLSIGRALAAAASHTDPDDVSSGLDAKTLTDDSDGTTLTYTLATQDADPYANTTAPPDEITWALENNTDGTADVCLDADVSDKTALTIDAFDGDCTSTTALGTASDVSINFASATSTYTVTLARSALSSVTEAASATALKYHVQTLSGGAAVVTDDAPDTAAAQYDQTLAAGASPTPSSSATADPSTSPTATQSSSSGGSLDAAEQSGTGVSGTTAGNTGDTTDTASHEAPIWIGFAVVAVAVFAGAGLSYRLLTRGD